MSTETETIINRLWNENRKNVIHYIYRLRDRLSTQQYRNFFSKEEVDDLYIKSIEILLKKFLNTGEVTDYIRTRKLQYGIVRLEFIKVLEKKIEEFYFSLGKGKWEEFQAKRREYRRNKSKRWREKNRERFNELAKTSYHRRKEKICKQRKNEEYRRYQRDYQKKYRKNRKFTYQHTSAVVSAGNEEEKD